MKIDVNVSMAVVFIIRSYFKIVLSIILKYHEANIMKLLRWRTWKSGDWNVPEIVTVT